MSIISIEQFNELNANSQYQLDYEMSDVLEAEKLSSEGLLVVNRLEKDYDFDFLTFERWFLIVEKSLPWDDSSPLRDCDLV